MRFILAREDDLATVVSIGYSVYFLIATIPKWSDQLQRAAHRVKKRVGRSGLAINRLPNAADDRRYPLFSLILKSEENDRR